MADPASTSPPARPMLRSYEQTLKLTRYQLRDYLFSRRYVLMMAIVAIIGFILTVLLAYYRPPDVLASSAAFYGETWGNSATIIIIFAGIIFGGDAIAGEFQNKTGYFLMGLPVRRATVYTGKYIAAFLASLTAVLAFAVILLANGAYYLGADAFTGVFAESFGLAIVYLLALLGAVFLFSSMFKTSTYATLITAVLFLFGFSILQALIQDLGHITPWFILTYADTIIGGVFNATCQTSPGVHTCTVGGGGFTMTVDNASIPEGVGIMLAYFAVTSVLGLLLFEREEFT